MLVITGNPGVGKHTLAKRLAQSMGMGLLDINEIAKKSGVCKKSGSTLDVDTGRLAKIIKKMDLKDTIAVGHLAPYVLPKTQVKFALILRKNPYKLIPIYKKRNYTKAKADENAASEILGVTAYDSIKAFGMKKTAQLDMTGLTVKQAEKKAAKIIKGKRGDTVDWLQTVAKKGDLGRFFIQ